MIEPGGRPPAGRDGLSPWAAAALGASLVIVCPASGLVAIALAWRARRDLREHPGRRGAGMASAAMVLGAALTVAYVAGGWWWHVNVRVPIRDGPVAVFEAGERGDWPRVRAEFHGRGAVADDEEVSRFFGALRERYGRWQGLVPDASEASRVDPSAFDRRAPRIGYMLQFERGRVRAECEFIVADGSWLNLVTRWGRIRVIDEQQGELVYPAAATGAASGERIDG